LWHRDGVEIHDAIEAVVTLLKFDEFDERPEIIAKMEISGGLHAGEHAFLKV
jgi:L-fucose mutarotase/ribose pyranase (RbsD/FucU family)